MNKPSNLIVLNAPFNHTGVGTHATYLADSINSLKREFDIDFFIRPIGKIENITNSFLPVAHVIDKNRLYKKKYIEVVLDCPLSAMKNAASKDSNIYTVFEMTPVHGNAHMFLGQDTLASTGFRNIFFPSQWAAKTFNDFYGDELSSCVPEGVDSKYFEYLSLRRFSHHKDVMDRPLNILNVGKFEKRKGHYALLDALLMGGGEFTHGVELNCYWDNPWNPGAAHEALSIRGFKISEARVNKTIYINKNIKVTLNVPVTKHFDLIGEVLNSHLAVYPSFAEGWGLPICEAMSLSIPTITQSVTGISEYADTYYSSLENIGQKLQIPEGTLTRAIDGVFFKGHGSWYELSPVDIYEKIMEFYINEKIRSPEPYQEASEIIRKKYSWENSARILLNKLLG